MRERSQTGSNKRQSSHDALVFDHVRLATSPSICCVVSPCWHAKTPHLIDIELPRSTAIVPAPNITPKHTFLWGKKRVFARQSLSIALFGYQVDAFMNSGIYGSFRIMFMLACIMILKSRAPEMKQTIFVRVVKQPNDFLVLQNHSHAFPCHGACFNCA